MTVDPLDKLLDDVSPPARDAAVAWQRLGFLRNPFPSRAHPIWEVFHNQAEVRTRFLRDLGEFLREQRTTTLFFTGGNRVGKTHFMQHHRIALSAKLRARGMVVPIALISAQSADFWQLYRELIEQVDDALRVQRGAGLFERELSPRVAQAIGELPSGDLKRALTMLAENDDEDRRRLLAGWIRGERLRQRQRAEIGVTGLIDSHAQMLNALGGLTHFLMLEGPMPAANEAGEAPHSMTPCPGILLFLDEFEIVWKQRRDRRDLFLQALRALLDACPKGLFLCVGMATGIGPNEWDVQSSYPALYERLVGAAGVPQLVQIGSLVDAREYARAFEDYGRGEFERATGQTGPSGPLLDERTIEAVYRKVPGGLAGSIAQGAFFDGLHREAEKKLNGAP